MLPATRHKWTRPALTPAGTRLTYPGGMEGWVDLGGWLHTEMVYPSAVDCRPPAEFFTVIRPANGIFRQIFGWPNIFVADFWLDCFRQIFGGFSAVWNWNSRSNLAWLWRFCCMLRMTSVASVGAEMATFHLIFILTFVPIEPPYLSQANTRKTCCCMKTARCRSSSFWFKVRR